jgi:hypothetical protein
MSWVNFGANRCCFSSRTKSIAALLFLVAAVADADGTGSKTLRIGYFLQESQPPYRIGAIKMAIDKAQADGWLSDYNYRCAWEVDYLGQQYGCDHKRLS